ncbi:2-dehydropantoate 2-reductase [Desulfosarcina ovata]|uniref:2-dehydropantoate 2-reductase n=1 Tax=Desulfosarcina ovata subsp. ovata TaxID=2752305 RepID=A0A5K8ACP2_9BACT|nr:2-dehydropantoate 2-reductase [Desulfosarcina ovata]BBO89710.1 2-dehydropantoate 2-reductase [Desulfosarcina ovata subsp. ovata]
MKKVCIYGIGAVGGFLGAMLARSGCEVSAVARGATLEALEKNGLRLEMENQRFTQPIRVSEDPKALGVQDLVIVAVKAQSLSSITSGIPALIGPQTTILTAMNGVPWWFFDGFGGKCAGLRLTSVDPTGAIAAAIPTGQVVGGVVHGSFALNEPGFVRHVFGKKMIIGKPDGTPTRPLPELAGLLGEAGMEIDVSEHIQRDIWFKLWGNMTMNPVSAITGATCDKILDDPLVNRFCLNIMAEAAGIGAIFGCPIEQSGEDRNAMTRKLGAFKTSMLQDVEAGRAVELDALVGAVQEIGRHVGVETPTIDTLLGLARLHAQVRGLYPVA